MSASCQYNAYLLHMSTSRAPNGGCACAQGRALLRKLEASPDWGQITAISRHPDPDLEGTRVKFLPLDLLDSEARAHRQSWD